MPYHASASRATLIGYLFAPLLNTKYYSLKLNVLHDMTPDYLRQLILVENHEYRIKNCKVHVSRQANHSQFTDFNFVFSPFTKLKALNPVSRKNPFHTLDKGRTIRERKNPSMCVHMLSLILKHFSAHTSTAVTQRALVCQRRSSQASLDKLFKTLFEENVRKF